MGRVEFSRPCPPLHAPRPCLHSSHEGRARGNSVSSVLALPCCRHCGSVECDGKGAGPLGQKPPPSCLRTRGATWNMSATDLVAIGGGRLRPRGGDRRRGIAQLLRGAKMRLKTSRSAAGGSATDGGGCPTRWGAGEEGESRGAGSALGLAARWALSGAGLVSSSARGGGGNRSAPPPPGCADPTLAALTSSMGRSGLGRFGGLGLSGPRARGGRAPSVLGGAAHWRATGGPVYGRG